MPARTHLPGDSHCPLKIFFGDCDSHCPLKMFFGDGKRDRTCMSQAFRTDSNRKRERERRLKRRRESADSDQGDVNDASVS